MEPDEREHQRAKHVDSVIGTSSVSLWAVAEWPRFLKVATSALVVA